MKNMTYQLVQTISDIPTHLWQADNPFTSQAYWQALEDNELIGKQSDWQSLYVIIYTADEDTSAIAMMPIFIKNHHAGEYVFDHAWAHAFHQHGIDYYPRLVTSVPFTPVVGQRIWLAKDIELTTDILQTCDDAINQIAISLKAPTWHGLFIPEKQKDSWQSAITNSQSQLPLLERNGCQFLWQNQHFDGNYFTDFDDFLSKLTAKKRKNIRAERKKITKQNIRCQWKLASQKSIEKLSERNGDIDVSADLIDENDWKNFYHCYAMTYAVRGQRPYLNLPFFTQLADTMPENLALAQAIDEDGSIIACSLFFYDENTLYGRYWGCLQEVNCLHFELCYYQGISFAIALGLKYFDPGTQGEHKLIRGFEPVTTYSLHKVYIGGFIPAIEEYCQQERADNAQYIQQAVEALPFKQVDACNS